MASFRILNFGCRTSQADGAALKAQLLDAGFAEACNSAPADLAILNTCTVTAAADAEVRQIIRRIHREDPGCRVLVTGCYAQRAPGEVAELPGVAWVVGNSHKHLIPEILSREQGTGNGKQRADQHVAHGERTAATNVDGNPALAPAGGEGGAQRQVRRLPENVAIAARAYGLATETPLSGLAFVREGTEAWVGELPQEFHFLPVGVDDRTRPTLKIQDGCNARCSFCVIPSVRGRSRSFPPEEVVARIRALELLGYREVVLSGINLGSYGLDLHPRITFLNLLERVLEQTSLPRLRISSIEPMDVRPELIRLVAGERRMADHFHVPLQSGCDRILRQMNRRYWTSHYAERILAIRELMPHCGIGADVMVGFPGETDDDHAASMRFIDSLPFTYLHIFPYSARPSTPAAARPDQVNGRLAHNRGAEFRALIGHKRREFMEAQVGRVLSVLTLSEPRPGKAVALSSNYIKVSLPECRLPRGQLVDVCVEAAQEGCLAAHRV